MKNLPNLTNSDTLFSRRSVELQHSSYSTIRISSRVSTLNAWPSLLATPFKNNSSRQRRRSNACIVTVTWWHSALSAPRCWFQRQTTRVWWVEQSEREDKFMNTISLTLRVCVFTDYRDHTDTVIQTTETGMMQFPSQDNSYFATKPSNFAAAKNLKIWLNLVRCELEYQLKIFTGHISVKVNVWNFSITSDTSILNKIFYTFINVTDRTQLKLLLGRVV